MLIKRVSNGYLLPRFYGVAWFDWQASQAVCLPLGVNVLAALGRSVYFSIKHAGRIVHQNPRDAYAQGLRDGLEAFDRARAGVEPTHPWPRA
jgi:hypothetical protein